MQARFRSGLLVLALLSVAPAAFSQALPDTLRAAGVTVAQWKSVQDEVKRAAAARGASERALAAVAQRVSASLVRDGKVDVDELVGLIDGRAQQLAELQTKLAALERADDPAIASLLAQAHAAIDAGDLTGGDQLLARAGESDLAAIALDKAKLSTRQTRAARTIGERAQLASLTGDYLSAANLFAQAAMIAPETDKDGRWAYVHQQAIALKERGSLFNEPAPLRDAVRLYQNTVLPQVSRAAQPTRWTQVQNELGNALETLGERGDDSALRAAEIAYRAALEGGTLERSPLDWAAAQNGIGLVFLRLGERGHDDALAASVAAFRAALTVVARDKSPRDWATAQMNLGSGLRLLGERGDRSALEQSLAAYDAALTVFTPEQNPAGWASVKMNTGNALIVLSGQTDAAVARKSVEAFEAALTVFTAERSPAAWAATQNGLGTALTILGALGDDAATVRSVAALEAALSEWNASSDPMGWATAQGNLANALFRVGQRGETAALAKSARAMEAALSVFTRDRAPDRWAMLQNNLGELREEEGKVEHARRDFEKEAGLLNQAVGHFQLALEVLTVQRAPALYQYVADNLSRTKAKLEAAR